ncbi:MAG: T9SS type A sorting domain-containing protein [Lacibacter sp.]
MKLFTLVTKNLFFLLSFVTTSVTVFSQTASISPSTSQTTFAGGSIEFTTTRSNGFSGTGSYTYTWSAPGATISGTNPYIVSGGGSGSSTKTITFPSAGTYNVSCTVSRGTTTVSTSTVSVEVFSPNLYSTSGTGTVKAYRVNSVLGIVNYGPVTVFTPSGSTAGLGKNKANVNDPEGNLYYILNTSGNNGAVQIYSATPTGSSNVSVGTIDMNGTGDNTSLGFVRLGFDANGKGWIIAGDGASALYIASFQGNGVNPISNVNTFSNSTLTIAGGAASDFQNGDLAISASGTLYALANITGGDTYIYTLNSLTTPTTLTKKWTVQTGGATFSGSVNGVAWTQTGSMHISTANGIYFIDQTTTNSVSGTVQASLISSTTGLTDLASSEFPGQSTLPVVYSEFKVKKNGSNAELAWTTENEINNDHFIVERSTDGVRFQKAGTVNAKGSGASKQSYSFIDPLGSSAIVYYRLQQVDVSGASTYSNIISLRNSENKVGKINVYPNPFVSDIKVQVQSDKKDDLIVRVSNMAGQVVLTKKFTLQTGDNVIVLTGVETLKTGIYSVEMITDGWKTVQRVTKQ